MTELKEEYNLDEALKLYDLMMMERDIEYLKSVYAEREGQRSDGSERNGDWKVYQSDRISH